MCRAAIILVGLSALAATACDARVPVAPSSVASLAGVPGPSAPLPVPAPGTFTLSPGASDATVNGQATAPVVTGSGHISLDGAWRVFNIHVLRRADGSHTGSVNLHKIDDAGAPLIVVKGSVVCAAVRGTQAFVSYLVTEAPIAAHVGTYGVVLVEDNGAGDAALPDRITKVWYNYPQSTATWWCSPAASNPFPLYSVESGGITIH